MKLVMISDTHNKHNELSIPQGDILIHAGDLTNAGRLKEIQDVAAWLNKLTDKFEHVICTGGNHDFGLEIFKNENEEDLLRETIFKKVHYLRDSGVTISGKNFYGYPWTKSKNWAFDGKIDQMKASAAAIPDDTDVLITHSPAHGVLDYFWGNHLGCEYLSKRIAEIYPAVHVFGHIHNCYGQKLNSITSSTASFNAASTKIVTRDGELYYGSVNAPLEFEI